MSEWNSGNTYCYRATNGINGCELWVLDEENTPIILKDIHQSGDSIPGKILGLQSMETERGLRFCFDADDGIHGRELWVSDGTSVGTAMLGDMETGDAIDWNAKITAWQDGVVFTTNGQQGHRMWWSNGSVTTSIWQAPWFSGSASSELLNQSSALTSLGQGVLQGDESGLWFVAKDSQIGLEMMLLTVEGQLRTYDLQPFGDSSPSTGISIDEGFVVVASDGTGRQLAHLDIDGGYQWITSMTRKEQPHPVTTMAPKFGLHQIGDSMVFDVVYRGADATLFTYSFATACLELSSKSLHQDIVSIVLQWKLRFGLTVFLLHRDGDLSNGRNSYGNASHC
jgi:ELWxxDGT repeat protein